LNDPTGKYKPGDEAKLTIAPTAVCSDFAAAVDWVLRHNESIASSTAVSS